MDSEFPGYVYLVKSYLLAECEDDGKYYAIWQFEPQYLTHDDVCPTTPVIGHKGDILPQYVHGPAVTAHFSKYPLRAAMKNFGGFVRSSDSVRCRRCLLWPPQAADWPTRNRKYSSWPESATVDRVVAGGCDVVPVAHRLCRQDEWMDKHQWRLSFSRAEIILLNSWIPEQQIVYHMLRSYVKTERLSETGGNGAITLSNYHIKTLMLWACELRPRSWWTDDENVVEISDELLHILVVWLTGVRCKHYFISNCNLLDGIDNPCSIQLIVNNLRSVTPQSLAKWYINNYIRQCADGAPEVSRLFDDTSTNAKIKTAVSAVVDFRSIITTSTFTSRLNDAQYLIMQAVSGRSLTVRSTCLWMTELAKLHQSLPVYFICVVFLHVAFKTTRDSLTDELLDVLATIYRLARQISTADKDLRPKCFYESIQLFISEELGLTSVRREQNVRYEKKLGVYEHSATPVRPRIELNKSELVEVLQRSAVEHLTTCRQLQARDYYPEGYVGTSECQALYAFKRGEYQHCLQLCALYILTLFDKIDNGCLELPITSILMLPELMQLMDDDIVSLVGLTMIINPSCSYVIEANCCDISMRVSQVSLSLYLMIQCQIKLRHSLSRTLDYVKVTARRLDWFRSPLDELLLKLVERKIQYIMS